MSRHQKLPDRVRAVLDRRRSGAAGVHTTKKPRGEDKRRAIAEGLIERNKT